jgi:hypothetical protein
MNESSPSRIIGGKCLLHVLPREHVVLKLDLVVIGEAATSFRSHTLRQRRNKKEST